MALERRLAEVEMAWAEIRLSAYQAAAVDARGGGVGDQEEEQTGRVGSGDGARRGRLENLGTRAMVGLAVGVALLACAVTFAVLWFWSGGRSKGEPPAPETSSGPVVGRFSCKDQAGDADVDGRRGVAWDLIAGEADLDGELLVVRFRTAGNADDYGDARFVLERGPIHYQEGFELEVSRSAGGYLVSVVSRRGSIQRRELRDVDVTAVERMLEFSVPREQLPVFRHDMFFQWGAGVEDGGSDVCSAFGD